MKKFLPIPLNLLYTLSLTILLSGACLFSFSQCDSITPVWIVDLSSNPDSVWDYQAQQRDGYCCNASGTDRCINFIVTLHPSVGGIYFGARNPGPSGNMYFVFECDSAKTFIVNKDTACVNGPGPHSITICKPGGDNPTYTIAGIGSGDISPPITVSNACFDTLFATGFTESSLTWTSVPPDSVYNSFLSCASGCDTTIVTPYGNYPDSIMYKVCGSLTGINCGGGVQKCDSTWVHFVSTFSVGISPQNPTICFGGTPATLSAVPTGGAAPYTYLWSTGATTQSISVSSGNAGLYWVEVKDTLECAGVRDSVVVTEFTTDITADAGTDLSSCEDNPSVTLNGSVQQASGGIWIGGTGTFAPDDTTLNATYTPDAAEISSGTATLLLITTGTGICPADTDSVVITITTMPFADAGSNQNICADNGAVILSGNVSGGTITGQWTTSGNGTFAPDDSTLNASYTLSPSDISAGTITLFLTSTNNSQCIPVSDSIQINIIPPIIADAGIDQSVCANNNVTSLNGNVSGPTTTGVWTTSGTGNFSPNDSDFFATYTPSANDTTTGIIEIILTSTNNGICNAVSDTMVLTITGIPQIDAGFDQTVCKNNSSATLNGIISGGTITGQWTTNGDGNFSPNDSDLTAIYIPGNSDTANGNVTIILTSTNNGGCNAVVDSLQINFTESPTADAGNNQTVCADAVSVSLNGNVTISTGGIWTTTGSGTFSPNDSLLNTTYVPDANDTTAGLVEVILTTTGNGNCNAVSDTLLLTITDAPIVDAGTNQTVCANNADVSLNGSVTISSGGIWTTNGSGNFSPNDSDLNAIYIPSANDTAAGTITIFLTTTGNGSCNAVSDSLQIAITPAPVANAGTDISVCKTNPDAVLNGSIFISTGGIWTTSGTGNFSPNDSDLNATYIPSATDILNGNVTITLTTIGNANCNAVSDEVLITFTTDSIAVDAGNDTTVCSASFPLNGNVFIATGGVWTTNGSGTFSPDDSTLNATYTFSSTDTANGSVTFYLITTGNGGCAAKNDSMTVSIAEQISVNASAADSVCGNGEPIPLNAASSTLQGIWTTSGDGSFSPNNTTMNAFYIPGTNDISGGQATVIFLSTNNNGCAAVSDTLVITLVPAPFTDFISDSVCLNNATTFTDATTTIGTIVSWEWNFGDGNSDTNQNTTHIYNSDGNYTVMLITESNFGCIDTMIKIIPVHPLPNVDFTTASQCFVDSVFFTDLTTINSGSIVQWNWNLGDGNNYSVQNPSHLYASAGIYTISLNIISDFGCADSVSKTISIQPAPVADFGSTTPCFGNATLFTDSSAISSGNIISWQWDFGDGNISSAQNPSHLFSTENVFNVQLIVVSDSGCIDTIVKQITVNPLPDAGFTSSAECFVDSVFFNDTSSISSGSITQWLWNFGDGNTSSQQNPGHFYSSNGNYSITLIVFSSFGCSDTVTQSISAAPAPNAAFIMSTSTVCINQPILFASNSEILPPSTIVSTNWDFGDGNSSASPTVFHSFSTSDTFTIVLTVTTDLGCTDDTFLTVVAHPSPVADFIANNFCVNETTLFSDTSFAAPDTVVSWQWYFGNNGVSFSENPEHFYGATGSYPVSLIVTTNHGCKDTVTEVVTINPAPNAGFQPDKHVAFTGDGFNFTNLTAGGSTWFWDFGDSSGTSSSQHPSYVYADGGFFIVTLIATNNFGCTDTAVDSVIVNVPPQVPNGFSPNGDGQNDVLLPMGGPYKQLEFKIFNNWGEMIFISRNAAEGWDGTKNGIPQPLGVYVYILDAVTEDGNEYRLNGDVTLLR